MKRILKKSFIIFYLLLLGACQTPSNINKSLFTGNTMGTSYSIVLITEQKKPEQENATLHRDIKAILKDVNQQFSTYDRHSTISQFNRFPHNQWFVVNQEFYTLLKTAQTIAQQSNGFFDATVSPLVDLWGFGTKETTTPPQAKSINDTLAVVGYRHLQLHPNNHSIKKTLAALQIDLSSIAKGYAVDKISDALKNQGYSNYLVEIGGEIRVSGLNEKAKPWHIGLNNKEMNRTATVSKGFEISNLSVATSGDDQNFFIEKGVRRSHIINPKTGYPITHKLTSVTVLHESAQLADAYATALLAMGEKRGKVFANTHDLHVVMIIRNQKKIEYWSNTAYFKL